MCFIYVTNMGIGKKKQGVDRWVIYDEVVGDLDLNTEKTNISDTCKEICTTEIGERSE